MMGATNNFMKLLKYIFEALKFWFAQNIIELSVILVLGYLGIDLMGDFCKKCLFIENLEATAWGIGIKTLIFLLPYLLIFTITSFIPHFKNIQTKLKYAYLNSLISCSIILLIGILKPHDTIEILLPLLATFIASILIVIYSKIKATQ